MENAVLHKLAKYSISSIEGLRDAGFVGFETIEQFRAGSIASVPNSPGVYLVIRYDPIFPKFLDTGTGGHFKGNDPNVPVAKLREKWVNQAIIIYIGQSGSGSHGTLSKRIRLLLQFGQGKPVGHKGGRIMWQLNDAEQLQVCWCAMDAGDPQALKDEWIEAFKVLYGGRLPFANLVG